MAIPGREWIVRFAREAGVPQPTNAEVESLLTLAGLAAHASERTAAPISCWIAASAGLSPAEALDAADRLCRELGEPGVE